MIWKRAVGVVTSEQMIDELANWDYAAPQREPATPLPESVPGAWADVETALIEGLITESEVAAIGSRPGRK